MFTVICISLVPWASTEYFPTNNTTKYCNRLEHLSTTQALCYVAFALIQTTANRYNRWVITVIF
jgi:hypothetical protein